MSTRSHDFSPRFVAEVMAGGAPVCSKRVVKKC